MKPLTVKIPKTLETKLWSKANAPGNEPVSALVRRALAREMVRLPEPGIEMSRNWR